MDAVEEASGRVEGGGVKRKRAFDRLGGLGLGLGCHLQARLLCRQLVLTETLAGAPEALGSFLESASARGRVVFGELLQQVHVNGVLSVGSCSWVWGSLLCVGYVVGWWYVW
jgi:hypothetical protein